MTLILALKALVFFLTGYGAGRFYAYKIIKAFKKNRKLVNKTNRAIAQNPKPLEN